MRGVTQPLSTTISCYTLPGFIHQARKSRVSLWPNESDSGGSSWLIKRQSGWAKSDDDSGLVFGYDDFSTVEQEKINVYSRNSYVKNGSTKYYLYPFVILSPRLKSYGKLQMDRGEYIYISTWFGIATICFHSEKRLKGRKMDDTNHERQIVRRRNSARWSAVLGKSYLTASISR